MMKYRYLLKKVGIALGDCYKAFFQPHDIRLIMTLLVRNEEDILEENLIFHKQMGVDGFIVTDNGSKDRTTEILRTYKEKGWILEIIEEDGSYDQAVWVDRMIWKAKTQYGADWVVNADADEFWYAPTGNMKDELRHTHYNVQICDIRNIYPNEHTPFWTWEQQVTFVPNPFDYELSIHSIFIRTNKKVIHRTCGYIQIASGNRNVAILPRFATQSAIRIYHYMVRGRKQFVNKIANNASQYLYCKDKQISYYWRYFYNLYKRGLLENHYDQVIGKKHYDELCEDYYIRHDVTMSSYFREHMHEQIAKRIKQQAQ